MQPLLGSSITLREPKRSDASKLAEFAYDPKIRRYMRIPDSYGVEDAEEFIQHLALQGFGRQQDEHYAITLDDSLIGMIGLTDLSHYDGSTEVGAWIGAPYRRRGYTGEALDLMIGRAFDGLRLNRITAETFASNTGARRLLESRGFVSVHTRPKVVSLDREEIVVYGLQP